MAGADYCSSSMDSVPWGSSGEPGDDPLDLFWGVSRLPARSSTNVPPCRGLSFSAGPRIPLGKDASFSSACSSTDAPPRMPFVAGLENPLGKDASFSSSSSACASIDAPPRMPFIAGSKNPLGKDMPFSSASSGSSSSLLAGTGNPQGKDVPFSSSGGSCSSACPSMNAPPLGVPFVAGSKSLLGKDISFSSPLGGSCSPACSSMYSSPAQVPFVAGLNHPLTKDASFSSSSSYSGGFCLPACSSTEALNRAPLIAGSRNPSGRDPLAFSSSSLVGGSRSPTCLLLTKLDAIEDWIATKILFRTVFFSMVLFCVVLVWVQGEMSYSNLHNRLNSEDAIMASASGLSSGTFEELLQSHLSVPPYTETHKKLWTTKAWRQKVQTFSDLFQSLLDKRLLQPSHRALCVGAGKGEEVLALWENAVTDAVGIDLVASPPLVLAGDACSLPFPDAAFDFIFSNSFDSTPGPERLVAEMERTLKPGGIAAMHVSLTAWSNNFIASNEGGRPPAVPVTMLFHGSDIVLILQANVSSSPALDTLIVFKKGSSASSSTSCNNPSLSLSNSPPSSSSVSSSLPTMTMEELSSLERAAKVSTPAVNDLPPRYCDVSPRRRDALANIEPLIYNEPDEPWVRSRGAHVDRMKYVPDPNNNGNNGGGSPMVTTTTTMLHRSVYVDVGAGAYDSSIGGWFMKHYYPKAAGRDFQIFAMEPNESFAPSYAHSPVSVTLLPYAAWIRNETVNMAADYTIHKSHGGGGRRSGPNARRGAVARVPGIDFADWLTNTVSVDDFVVVKMDAMGVEFDLFPRLYETGAICLIDELFVECHYKRWNAPAIVGGVHRARTAGYADCLRLFEMLRYDGVAAHQWWW